MPTIKEPRFFIYEGVDKKKLRGHEDWIKNTITDLTKYTQLFSGVSNEKRYGEASVEYFFSRVAPLKIKQYIPDVKIVLGLRNPISRVFSNYLLCRRDGLEREQNFYSAISNSPIKHEECGLYHDKLERFFSFFPREQIYIYRFDDFKKNQLGIVKEIFEFLEVGSDFMPDVSIRYNETVAPIYNDDNGEYEANHEIDKIQRRLAALYRGDLIASQVFVDKDITSWIDDFEEEFQRIGRG